MQRQQRELLGSPRFFTEETDEDLATMLVFYEQQAWLNSAQRRLVKAIRKHLRLSQQAEKAGLQ